MSEMTDTQNEVKRTYIENIYYNSYGNKKKEKNLKSRRHLATNSIYTYEMDNTYIY